MNDTQRERYLELQKQIREALDLRYKARKLNDNELLRDSDSKLDFAYGALNELTRWFGDFSQSK